STISQLPLQPSCLPPRQTAPQRQQSLTKEENPHSYGPGGVKHPHALTIRCKGWSRIGFVSLIQPAEDVVDGNLGAVKFTVGFVQLFVLDNHVKSSIYSLCLGLCS